MMFFPRKKFTAGRGLADKCQIAPAVQVKEINPTHETLVPWLGYTVGKHLCHFLGIPLVFFFEGIRCQLLLLFSPFFLSFFSSISKTLNNGLNTDG
jgi:hypothetical protein